MPAGAITNYIDVAQITLYAFWIFFAGLIIYLRGEDKREGYPLVSERTGRVVGEGFPRMPRPKIFLLDHGHTRLAPRREAPEIITTAEPVGPWPGSPLHPIGNPLLAGVGPGAYVQRPDVPEFMSDSTHPKIVPLRVASDYVVDPEDPNPIGMPVVDDLGRAGGVITDVWVDRAEALIRYIEVDTGTARVLVPMTVSRVDSYRRVVVVRAVLANQLADVPVTKSPDEVTMLEEDKISAYYGAGQLYATPSRLGPLL